MASYRVWQQFVIRPINAYLCTIGAGLSFGERAFIVWLSPRGIVAAAVSSVFFIKLQEIGMPRAELLLTAKPLADKLGINIPEPNGVLFFGANDIALTLEAALKEHSINIMLADTSWRNIRAARQQGFKAYHGNPTSGHAAENLELQGIGKLFAVSSNRDANALAGMHFRQEFGSPSIFTLEGTSDDAAYERFDTANRNRANPLFDASLSHSKLSRRMCHGKIRHILIPEEPEHIDTELGSSIPTSKESKESASLEKTGELPADNSSKPGEPNELYNEDDLKLFAIDEDGKLYVYGAGDTVTLKPGWQLILLTAAD